MTKTDDTAKTEAGEDIAKEVEEEMREKGLDPDAPLGGKDPDSDLTTDHEDDDEKEKETETKDKEKDTDKKDSAKDDSESKDKDETKEGDEEEGKEKVTPPPNRKAPPMMPVAKHTDTLRPLKEKVETLEGTLADKESKIAELETALAAKDPGDEVRKFAEANNISIEAVTGLVGLVEKRIGPVTQEATAAVKKLEAAEQKTAQETQFQTEVTALRARLTENPDEGSGRKELSDATVAELRTKAFSQPYLQTPLHLIYFGDKDLKAPDTGPKPKQGKTAETARPGQKGNKAEYDFEAIKDDPAAIAALPQKDFDAFDAWLIKTSQVRVSDNS